MKKLVIMPGGFHPFHAGHMALYTSARQAFPDADVYVAATNDTSERPFPFAIKEKLAKLAGVEAGHFVQVKSPFQAREITQNYDPETTALIFVRSEKDRTKPPQAGGTKKDGSPAYLQPITAELNPMNKNGYMAYLPTVEFGPGMTSATEIRTAWPELNDKRKTALVMSLYPKTQSNPKLAQTVIKMLDTAIGSEESLNEAVGGNYLYHSTETAATAKAILSSGVFKAGNSGQNATDAQVGNTPTVSFGRNIGYQTSGTNVNRDYQVVFVVNRDALESKYKTIGTSQSVDIRGLGYGSGNDSDKLQNQTAFVRKMAGLKTTRNRGIIDTNNDGKFSKDEIEANPELYTRYVRPKAGGEYEEVVPTKTGNIPWQGMLVGFYLVPGKAASQDPELLSDPRRLEMTGPNTFVNATAQNKEKRVAPTPASPERQAEYQRMVQLNKTRNAEQLANQGVAESKSLTQKVKIVKGTDAGKTGWIREIKHGAFKGAPKTYYVDLDDGGQANNLSGTALRLVKDNGVVEGSEQAWEVSFSAGEDVIKVHASSKQEAIYKATQIAKSQGNPYPSVDWARHKEQGVAEAAYPGNIGIMELAKFFDIATLEEKTRFKQLMNVDEKNKAWKLIQKVTGVKLQGKEFAEQRARPSVAEGSLKEIIQDPDHPKNMRIVKMHKDDTDTGKHRWDIRTNKGEGDIVDSYGSRIDAHHYLAKFRKEKTNTVKESSENIKISDDKSIVTISVDGKDRFILRPAEGNKLKSYGGGTYKYWTIYDTERKKDRINSAKGMMSKNEAIAYVKKLVRLENKSQQAVKEGLNQPIEAGQALQSLKNLALMKSALTMQQLVQAGRESIITNAINAAKTLEQSYLANKQQGNAIFVRALRDEIDNFRRGAPINASFPESDNTSELGELLQGKLSKVNFQQGMAEGSTETPQQQQVRTAITKGMEKWDQNGLATYQSQPAKRNYFASSGWASGQLEGINSIDPDGTVVIELNDTTTAGLVKKLASLGGMPGVKTRQLKMTFDPAKANANGVIQATVAEGSLADAAKHVKKGALHKQEHIPLDKKIGAKKLKSLKAHGTPLERKRANFALNIQGIKENATQLSIQQLATISDAALDNAYQYGRNSPGNTFGWQANLKSAEFAKRMIDAGVTDIEKISDAIHKGWNVTAKAFVQNPEQFDDTEKLKAAGKLEAKLQQRAKLMNIEYAQLPNDKQEKDRVVAGALLQALKGEPGLTEARHVKLQKMRELCESLDISDSEKTALIDRIAKKVKDLFNRGVYVAKQEGRELGSAVKTVAAWKKSTPQQKQKALEDLTDVGQFVLSAAAAALASKVILGVTISSAVASPLAGPASELAKHVVEHIVSEVGIAGISAACSAMGLVYIKKVLHNATTTSSGERWDRMQTLKQRPDYKPMAGPKPGVLPEQQNSSAVTDLEHDMKPHSNYAAIDHLMKYLAAKHHITPEQLHDKFVNKHGMIPDEWIKHNPMSEADEVPDYDRSDELISRLKTRVAASKELARQGKKPVTRLDPKTGKYYVDFTDGPDYIDEDPFRG